MPPEPAAADGITRAQCPVIADGRHCPYPHVDGPCCDGTDAEHLRRSSPESSSRH